ncbi:MAG: TRAP transporter small permease [Planctomycetes bacterium]|nr:TRAP transporter small permease [Planctomycetota bacterium]
MFMKIKKVLDTALEWLVMVVVGVLVLDVLWQVFTRKVLNDPSKWTEETAIFLLIWVSLLGAAVAMNRGAHLGIDYFTGKLSIRNRVATEVFVFAAVGLFSLYVMVIGGCQLVAITFYYNQLSPVWGIQMGYVYLAVPLSGLFMTFYSIIGLIERISELKKKQFDESLHVSESAGGLD